MESEIQDYIRERRRTYTRGAITDQLRSAGHGAADIEAAWAAVEAEEDAALRPARIACAYVLAGVLFFVGEVVLAVVLIQRSFSRGGLGDLDRLVFQRGLYLLPVCYLLAIAFGLWRGLSRRPPTAASIAHLVGAAVMALPFIVTGVCAVQLSPR